VAEWQTRQTQNPASATGGRTSTTTTREPLHYGLLALHRPSILDALPLGLSTRPRYLRHTVRERGWGTKSRRSRSVLFTTPHLIRILQPPTVRTQVVTNLGPGFVLQRRSSCLSPCRSST